MDFMNHARNCNCSDCINFRRGAIQKAAATEARVRRSRSIAKKVAVVERRERFNGNAASHGGELRTSLGVALLKALR